MELPLTIGALRAELSLTLAEMGQRIGLSKSQMHEVERSGQASLPVALEIEKLSEGRIDAAALCEAVRLARAACGGGCVTDADHGADGKGAGPAAATGQTDDLSGPLPALAEPQGEAEQTGISA